MRFKKKIADKQKSWGALLRAEQGGAVFLAGSVAPSAFLFSSTAPINELAELSGFVVAQSAFPCSEGCADISSTNYYKRKKSIVDALCLFW